MIGAPRIAETITAITMSMMMSGEIDLLLFDMGRGVGALVALDMLADDEV
jgi:hypothetical protein